MNISNSTPGQNTYPASIATGGKVFTGHTAFYGHKLEPAPAAPPALRVQEAVLLGTQVPLETLTTFAQPRLGTPKLLEESLRCNHYTRVVNGGDWLTFMPFGFGYGHHEDAVLMLPKDGHAEWNPGFFASIGIHLDGFVFNPRDNHSAREYWNRLKR